MLEPFDYQKKIPLVFITCGSFNPITNAHLRIFELARDHFAKSKEYKVVKGIISPVGDGYKKKGLISAGHRINMIDLSLKGNEWIEISKWEAENGQNWTRTIEVMNYHKKLLDDYYIENVKVVLLCGGDLLESFNVPGLWADEDVEKIVSEYGLVVIKRVGSNPEKSIYDSNILYRHKENISIITDWISNEISSTKIRLAISRNESVKYLINDSVIDYIRQENLYA